MGVITITKKGDFEKTTGFLNGLRRKNYIAILNEYGRKGVDALSAATPVDTGKTASSWRYSVTKNRNGYALSWFNDSQNKGISIVILNQYGHATKNGGWVEGRDFINPAMRPIFDQMADDLWREVNS